MLRPLAAPCPSSRRPQSPCSAPRASSGLAGSLPVAPGGGARAGSPLPRAPRRRPASRGGRAAAGHVGRTAPPGRLRCTPAARGPGPRLHREEAARALCNREVSAPHPSAAPLRGHLPAWSGEARRGAWSHWQPRIRAALWGSVRARAQPGGPSRQREQLVPLHGCRFCALLGRLPWLGPRGHGDPGGGRAHLSLPWSVDLGRGEPGMCHLVSRLAGFTCQRAGGSALAGPGPLRRRPVRGRGLFPCLGYAHPVDLGTAGVSGYVSVSACVLPRGRGWGVCPLALSRLMLPSPRVASWRRPGGHGPSACVRDALSEGTRCQPAAWLTATASRGAQGAAPPGSELTRVFCHHRQFLLQSGRLHGVPEPSCHLSPGQGPP